MGLKQQSFLNGPLLKPALKLLQASIKSPHPAFCVCWFLCQCFKFDEMCVCMCLSIPYRLSLCISVCFHVCMCFLPFEITCFQPLCLSFYPHTISLLPTLLVFPQIDNSHPIIPHFTLSFPSLNSICVCLWLLYSMLNF